MSKEHRKYYTNGKHDIRLFANESIPEGYTPGRVKLYKSTGQRWVNNGVTEYQIKKNDCVPNGFELGRLKFNPDTVEKRKECMKQKAYHYYNNGKKQLLIAEGDLIPAGYIRGGLPFSKQHREKLSNVHKGKKHSPETREKIAKHSNNNRKKARITNFIKYGCEYVSQVPQIREKAIETKRKNGTLNTSKPENIYLKYLQCFFGKTDIVRNYKDERYPFYCDFYIKSQDLFIELNLHWTHGGMLFDASDNRCIQQLREWEERAINSQFYRNAIETWTKRDVEKTTTARKNNLHYIVLYKL